MKVQANHRYQSTPSGLADALEQPIGTMVVMHPLESGADELLREQKLLFERIAAGGTLDECLTELCAAAGRLSPGTRAMVLVADEQAKTVLRAVSRHLPESFGASFEGLPLDDPRLGTCAEAVSLGEPAACEDIASDRRWSQPWRDLCAAHGILACYSMPLLMQSGPAAGSLVLYFSAARAPTERELTIAQLCTHIGAIAFVRERAERKAEAELADAHLLHAISAEIIQQNDAQALYEKITDAAMTITRSDFASMQMLYPERGANGELRLLASRGYDPECAKFWEWVRTDSSCTCGVSMKTGQRAIAVDVREFMPGTADLDNALRVGMLAMQSTPLISRSGKVVGMISTHWRQPHQPSERDLRLLDILARQAADLIERRHAEEALRTSEARLSSELERMSRLHALGAQAAQSGDIDDLLRQILAAAADFTGTDKGNIQFFNPATSQLRMVVHQGLGPRFVEYFAEDGWREGCGLAQRKMQRIVVEDVARMPASDGATERDILLADGVRAFQSTPIVTRDGFLLGMLNNHFRQPHRPADEDLRYVDLLARMAADLIERRQAEDELNASEQFNRSLMDGSADCVKVLDLEGHLLHMNGPGMCVMEIDDFGPLCGQKWAHLWPEQARVEILRAIERARAGETHSFMAFCPTAKGTPKWWDVNVSPVRDGTGRVVRLLSVSRDITERSREMEARGKLAAIVEFSDDAIVSKDLNGIIRSWNKGAERLLGYTALEAIGQPVTMLIPPERLDEEPGILERIRRGESIEHYETIRRRKDGTLLNISITVSPIKNAEGQIIGASKIARDISERKRAEEALRESEERARQALGVLQLHYEQSPVGLVQMDTELRYVRINDQLAAMNGIPAAEHIGKTIFEVVPDLASKIEGPFRRILETGESVLDIELEGDTAADPGVTHTFLESWFPLRDSAGKVMGLNLVAQDITERKKAAEKLHMAYQRAQVLSETLEALLRAEDLDRITHDLFGRVAAHLGVDTFFNFMLNEQGDALRLHACAGIPDEVARGIARLEFGQAICGTVAQTRQPIHATDIQHSDDDKAALVRGFGIQAYACHPLMIGERLLGTLSFASRDRARFAPDELEFLRSITQYVAVAMDRLQQQSRLRAAKDDAEAASRAKDNFLAQLSHELRTPLTPVLMSATALRDDEALPTAVRDELAMMVRNTTLEARLIDDLLDLTRITRGKLALRAEPCDLHSLLGNVIEIVRDEVREKQIAITVDLKAQHCHLTGDSARLQQVFWNLLRNAVKFTPANGHIRLASHDDVHRSNGNGSNGSCTGGRFSLVIGDDGIGFDPAAAARLFEPFVQEDGHGRGGLGLGLAITRAIVDLHKGSVRAESPGTGRGSTFTVELPVTGAPSTSRPPSTAHESTSPRAGETTLRLLLVEDHEATLLVLARLLRRAGHLVTTASSIAEARAAAVGETFDVMISDLGLPDGTGHELMKMLRDQYGLRGIALSGYGTEQDVLRAQEAGFVAHLIKPIDMSEVQRALRQVSAHLEMPG